MSEDAERCDITLHVVAGAEPITGSADTAGGDARWYVGWLELMAAIEALRGAPEPEDLPS
jgi:hypothetical protein